jgi:hypothetical protein
MDYNVRCKNKNTCVVQGSRWSRDTAGSVCLHREWPRRLDPPTLPPKGPPGWAMPPGIVKCKDKQLQLRRKNDRERKQRSRLNIRTKAQRRDKARPLAKTVRPPRDGQSGKAPPCFRGCAAGPTSGTVGVGPSPSAGDGAPLSVTGEDLRLDRVAQFRNWLRRQAPPRTRRTRFHPNVHNALLIPRPPGKSGRRQWMFALLSFWWLPDHSRAALGWELLDAPPVWANIGKRLRMAHALKVHMVAPGRARRRGGGAAGGSASSRGRPSGGAKKSALDPSGKGGRDGRQRLGAASRPKRLLPGKRILATESARKRRRVPTDQNDVVGKCLQTLRAWYNSIVCCGSLAITTDRDVSDAAIRPTTSETARALSGLPGVGPYLAKDVLVTLLHAGEIVYDRGIIGPGASSSLDYLLGGPPVLVPKSFWPWTPNSEHRHALIEELARAERQAHFFDMQAALCWWAPWRRFRKPKTGRLPPASPDPLGRRGKSSRIRAAVRPPSGPSKVVGSGAPRCASFPSLASGTARVLCHALAACDAPVWNAGAGANPSFQNSVSGDVGRPPPKVVACSVAAGSALQPRTDSAGDPALGALRGVLRASWAVVQSTLLPQAGPEVAMRWMANVVLLSGRYLELHAPAVGANRLRAHRWSDGHVRAFMTAGCKFFDGVYPVQRTGKCAQTDAAQMRWEADLWGKVAAAIGRPGGPATAGPCDDRVSSTEAMVLNAIAWATPGQVLSGRG